MARFRSNRFRAQRGRVTPGLQLRVGVFAVLTLLAIFGIYYVLSNYVLRHKGYQIAVHFRDVGGLQEGNTVQVAGVNAGLVSQVELLPDQTVDVICFIDPGVTIYRQSTFIVTTTITGQTTLAVRPPRNLAAATPLPTGILPEDQQPWGTIPPTLQDLVTAIEPRIKDLDKTLRIVNNQLPIIANRFDALAGHTDVLVTDADARLRALSGQLSATVVALDSMIQTSGANISSLTGNMNGMVRENRAKLGRLVDNLASASGNLNQTMATLASVAKDPSFKGNLLQTTANVKDASEKLKKVAQDIENVTGDPEVQSNLKGAVYDLSSTIAKANDILGNYSDATARESGASGSPGPAASPLPGSSPPPHRLRHFAVPSLVEWQVRESWLNNTSHGPQSDLNITLLPAGRSSLTFGANDLGHNASYNFLLNRRFSRNLQISGGVLYSNLGAEVKAWPVRLFGVDVRAYDPAQPKLDLYGNIELNRRLQLFYGQRNVFGAPNRFGPQTSTPAFGFQASY